jgi:hypothetical protein
MSKAFASQADLQEKQGGFTRLSEPAWAYMAEGDPDIGIIIGGETVRMLGASACEPQPMSLTR